MKKNTTEVLVKNAIICALYVAITLSIQPFAYGQIQFRVSEILILLVFIEPKYFWGLTLGCAIANLFSPLGLSDVIFGTMATVIALLGIIATRKVMGLSGKALLFSTISPVIANGIIIGFQLYYMLGLPLIPSMLYVAIGEFLAVTVVGVVLFKSVIHHPKLMERIVLKNYTMSGEFIR